MHTLAQPSATNDTYHGTTRRGGATSTVCCLEALGWHRTKPITVAAHGTSPSDAMFAPLLIRLTNKRCSQVHHR